MKHGAVFTALELPPADPEGRALWHLEIGYDPEELPPHVVFSDEDEGGYLGELLTCWRCSGEGFEVTCMDDLCHGAGYCMHGDGQRLCRECLGEGVL